MRLHDYWRSSAGYRVRIALGLKGISAARVPVSLLAGDQRSAAYRAVNPEGLLPALDTGEGVLGQSLAIIEYLEETVPEPALLPASPLDRAHARRLALMVACDIHPVNNLRILQRLGGQFGADQAAKDTWYRHWIAEGLGALEAVLAGDPRTGTFCLGERPGLADLCLVPQLYNARRFACPLDGLPTLVRIDAACRALPAFAAAAPEAQSDAS